MRHCLPSPLTSHFVTEEKCLAILQQTKNISKVLSFSISSAKLYIVKYYIQYVYIYLQALEQVHQLNYIQRNNCKTDGLVWSAQLFEYFNAEWIRGLVSFYTPVIINIYCSILLYSTPNVDLILYTIYRLRRMQRNMSNPDQLALYDFGLRLAFSYLKCDEQTSHLIAQSQSMSLERSSTSILKHLNCYPTSPTPAADDTSSTGESAESGDEVESEEEEVAPMEIDKVNIYGPKDNSVFLLKLLQYADNLPSGDLPLTQPSTIQHHHHHSSTFLQPPTTPIFQPTSSVKLLLIPTEILATGEIAPLSETSFSVYDILKINNIAYNNTSSSSTRKVYIVMVHITDPVLLQILEGVKAYQVGAVQFSVYILRVRYSV